MKIVTVVGARPQFIKAAVVSRAFLKHNQIEEIIIHTGQHYDANMSDVFFEEMKIPKPKYNLGISGLSHGAMTGEMLKGIEEVLIKEKPDWVLVYGDTNSTLAGALAACKLHIKIAHVEAGLRSFNMAMPEEINRILTDRISNILFCPTETAIKNLKNEGYDNINSKTINVGDVMLDAAIFYSKMAPDITPKESFVLATIHRAENTDDEQRLKNIFRGLTEIAKSTKIILPLHPRTKKIVETLNISTTGIDIIPPASYFEMISYLKECQLVVTDSGGLQKEAYFFKKQCITLRDETEWVELISSGTNSLVGSNVDKMLSVFNEMKNRIKPQNFPSLYGDGLAGEKIVRELLGHQK
ncbi:non-hydrolyzing UDP-N-acetylglucosamine 2-epimerase [Bdellovibrio sp. NC01]|uniref:non-hydrolyzing UDP-N-acetylglucosamine 2-epimerase n=1 Tax=Bdellovibrio sp. NC01 TaxID=2220073 RepID=UPI00115BA27B|nr:UDP-N-acetylglucosamine 2-epimerase (non-hydrolyzing) [Bdellovibrio sp. NC01]QDK37514.1 UDP-N-acetylglucosamine 2-epimerase (non-hydrolyzing) [Bdellovibrio sp. NC01]